MTRDLKNWRPCPRPERKAMEGAYVRLEPLDRTRHGDGLYEASAVADAGRRFAWLYEDPPGDRASFLRWVADAAAKEDPLYFAVIDKASGKAGGRQTLMRIDAANGCVEIGHIYWGPLVSRRPAASEALFLFAAYVFLITHHPQPIPDVEQLFEISVLRFLREDHFARSPSPSRMPEWPTLSKSMRAGPELPIYKHLGS